MDYDEEPFVVDRADSFPQDRAYPSRSTHSHIHKRPTDDSLYIDRHLRRHGTGDFEPRRRLRYTIPLRNKISALGDEEKGFSERRHYSRGDSTQFGIDREPSRDPAASSPPEFLEIISTKWVPDDEGREIVTLTVKDEAEDQKQEQIQCESRWKHIPSDGMTLLQFYREVMRTPGLGDDDLALVGRLLNKVKNTSEKKFVHGRYLKPITLVYEGEDPDLSTSHPRDEKPAGKIATFVSLPVFMTCIPKRHTSTKEFEGHPVRALLQSRYRLESTKRRDKEQVITKTTSIRDQLAHDNHVVHVPQIWALMINNYTIITCAALDASALRGDTIKLMSYTDAQLDEATWSVHFTDAKGKDFYLPLRYCKTWFDLVKQITNHCLHDEYSFIRDQLLRGGPVYQLVVASDGSLVNADKWSKLVEETKTEVIHLRLVDNESLDSRLLVTYYDDEGNEIIMDSDTSADTSSTSSSDDEGEDSDASNSSLSTGTSSSDMSRVIGDLRRLQAKLRGAEGKGNTKKIEDLKEHKIPALEEKLLGLTAAGLDLDPSTEEEAQMTKISIPGPHHRRPPPGHGVDHDPPLSPTERYRERLRSRSRSTSRARLVKGSAALSGSTYDLSLEEPSARGRPDQPWVVHGRDHSGSRSRYFRSVDYNAGSHTRPRIRSHMPNPHSLSRTSTMANHSRSRWDLLRSRVRDRQLPGLRTHLIDSDDIYYRPSDKQLARSYWDLVRSSVLEGDIYKLRDAEGAKKNDVIDRAKASTATTKEKRKGSLSSLKRLSDVPERLRKDTSTISPTTVDPPASSIPPAAQEKPAKGVLGVNQGRVDPVKPKVAFSKDSLQGKPKWKRLIKLAQEESAVIPKITTAVTAPENASPVSAHPTTDLPIFLWSTEHQPSERGNTAPKTTQTSNTVAMPSSLQKPSDELKRIIHTSKTDELILHAVLAEVHLALMKPKRGAPEYVVLYEKTAEKTYAEVVSSVNAIRNSRNNTTDGAAGDDQKVSNPISYSRRASVAFARRQSESTRSLASMSGRDEVGVVKVEVFDLARTILLAFVPQGYEAPVIFKYWGALHSLLTKDGTVLDYVRSRLLEIHDLIHSIQMGVRAEDGSKQQRYQIPRALPAAFQHLVLLLVVIGSISNWSEYSWSQMRSAFDDCEGLLVEGRKQLLLMIHTDDYRDSSGFQAVDAEALLSLILANLISSMSTNGDFHLTEVYAEYTNRIQGIVRDSASVKVYDDIKLLREELDIIKSTLIEQDTTLREFKSTIPLTYAVASLSVSILDRILESTSQRIDDFDELRAQAETARFLAAQSISLKAESNNKAIIVFTVVTIIFLPLSFVTSYLGMNTSDLRDMKSGQTLFWAIGAPVAVTVLGAALMAAFYGTLTQRVLGRAWRAKEKRSAPPDQIRVNLLLQAADERGKVGEGEGLGSLDEVVWICVDSRDIWAFYVEIPIVKNPSNMPYAAARLELFRLGWSASIGFGLQQSTTPSIRAEINEAPDGARAIELARNWIHQCCEQHKVCARAPNMTLPPCVVDVGLPDGSQEPRLVEQEGRKGLYLTLSHTWGGNTHETTTTANVEERKNVISLPLLPRTFRDAIIITRKLGFRYIWIDSLCVVQDSSEDWKANCRKMSDIYANSTLTIASLWAKGSHDGIFVNRNRQYPCTMFSPVRVSTESINGRPQVYIRFAPWHLYYALHASKLNKRGWVLQERILTPATLYYWTSEMFWECRSATASESQPQPLLKSTGHMKYIPQELQKEGLIMHPQGHLSAWYLLLEEYTKRELSIPSDRLPALLGLARKFGSIYTISHFAGLWTNDLHRGLLWHVWQWYGHTLVSAPATSASAPSWSWVAVNLPVVFAWSINWEAASLYYPVTGVAGPADAKIVQVVANHSLSSRTRRPKGSLQMWANIAVASSTATKTPSRRPVLNAGFCIRQKLRIAGPCPVRCALDSTGDVINSIYCARIATWEHDLGNKAFHGLHSVRKPVFAYYILLQRIAPVRSLLHPLDKGMFRRIGIGADEVAIVDSFFKSSGRYFITIV